MGSITTGIGLISGIDTAALIDSIITLESRGKFRLQERLAVLQAQQAALLDVNARLLNFKNTARAFRVDEIFRAALATSSNDDVLTATADTDATAGSFTFIVKQLVSSSQKISGGYATRDESPLGLDQISFEFGNVKLARDTALEDLNGGLGVDRGRITITDSAGSEATIDLTDVTSLNEVLDRINDETAVSVTAAVAGDHLVLTDAAGGAGALTVADAAGDATATDLGIAGSAPGGTLTGSDINVLGAATALRSLNDGNGVLVRDNVTDFTITAQDGSLFEVDLGRVDLDIDDATLLESLNNGAGVTFDDDPDTPDIAFVDRDGTEHEVDLTGLTTVGGLRSRIDAVTGGAITLEVVDGDHFKVVDATGGSGLLRITGAGDTGTAAAEDLGILEEAGVAADEYVGEVVPSTIDEASATTLQDVVDRINNALDGSEIANGGRIVASIGATGLVIQDNTVGFGNLIVTSTAANPDAAADLGIDTGAGGVAASSVSGERLIAGLNTVLVRSLNGGAGLTYDPAGGPAPLTAQTLLDDLLNGAGLTTNGNPGSPDIRVKDRDNNNHDVEVDGLVTVQDLIDAFDTATGGSVTLSIEGQALRVTDTTGGSSKLQLSDQNGATVATELGIDVNDFVDTQLGADTQPITNQPSSVIQVTNRDGASTLIDITDDASLLDVIDRINAAGAGVTAAVNDNGNGLTITDTTGGTGNLQISGSGATSLRIDADVASDTVRGGNLQLQYVSNATRLEDMNYGRGVGPGTFRITDGLGNTADVAIGGDERTLYDVILEINSRGLAVQARVNDNGDGLIIEEDPAALGGSTPFVAIRVESVNGSAASDLNIVGESEDIVGGFIDGSYELVVDLSTSDSLDDVVSKINEEGLPVSAAVLNTGSGATPYRLTLGSGVAGRAGDLVIDTGGVDLGLTALSEGRDAKVFFGSDDPADAFLVTSSTNTLTDVLPGVTIDLHEASDEAVTLTVARDVTTIVDAVRQFVTTFNDAIGRINDYDFFDTETEKRGVLLSDPTLANVRTAFYRVVTGRGLNVDGPLQFLSQVGVGVNRSGELTFDEDRFREAYGDDPDAVESLFATYEISSGTTEEIAEGITVDSSEITYDALGFGNLFDNLLDALTNSVDGTVTLADRSFQSQIDLTNSRIDTIDGRLESRRERLTAQYAGLETALAQLQAQANSLATLSSNLLLSGVGGA